MILQALSDLALDPSHCAIMGDQKSDIEAGAAVAIGLRVLIGPRNSQEREGASPP